MRNDVSVAQGTEWDNGGMQRVQSVLFGNAYHESSSDQNSWSLQSPPTTLLHVSLVSVSLSHPLHQNLMERKQVDTYLPPMLMAATISGVVGAILLYYDDGRITLMPWQSSLSTRPSYTMHRHYTLRSVNLPMDTSPWRRRSRTPRARSDFNVSTSSLTVGSGIGSPYVWV
jgi:hypothetical protein